MWIVVTEIFRENDEFDMYFYGKYRDFDKARGVAEFLNEDAPEDTWYTVMRAAVAEEWGVQGLE